MKKFLDKYQYIIGTVIIVALLIKDTIGAGILTFEVTDNWLPFELTITLYIVSITLLARHVYQKNKKYNVMNMSLQNKIIFHYHE